MKVLAHELFPNQKFVKEHGIELVDFRTLLSRSDYVASTARSMRRRKAS